MIAVRHARGQAAVETAITLPLVLFMILGTLQLFMVLQARILTQYAASRAVRLGALNFGDCGSMRDAAHLVLLPAIDAAFSKDPDLGNEYATQATKRMVGNRYLPDRDDKRDGPVVWLDRLEPAIGSFDVDDQEELWDLPSQHKNFRVRMVFWAPLKIPFANWVFARIALAQWGMRELKTANPYMPADRDANWVRDARSNPPRDELRNELADRYDRKQYVFPIEVTYATRMMSPARFTQAACPR